MGLMQFLFGKKQDNKSENQTPANQAAPEIPRDLFVKDEDEQVLKLSQESTTCESIIQQNKD